MWKLSAWLMLCVTVPLLPPPSRIITVPVLSAQRSTFNAYLPLSLSAPSLFFCHPALRISAQWQTRCNRWPTPKLKLLSTYSTDAAKNLRMAKTALRTADVKNDYKSTCGICWHPNRRTDESHQGRARCRCRQPTTPTGQVTLTTNGGKRGRRRGGAWWDPMLRHGLLARVSNH